MLAQAGHYDAYFRAVDDKDFRTMSLLQYALTQAQIWRAYLKLNAPDDDERFRAMEALRSHGNDSLTCLRFALRRGDSPRLQFAAAVVLHRLGDAVGITTLIEALRWRLPAEPALASELESAFIAIGSPDAVNALLTLWWSLPDWDDHNKTMESICRVWKALRDPHALDGLIGRALRIPDLFLQTVPAFGEMAICRMEPMLREADPHVRKLAIRALGGIVSGRGFYLLSQGLRDPDPQVRAFVPAALESSGGGQAAYRVIVGSVQEGFSTREAVESLLRIGPVPYEALILLVSRWNTAGNASAGDTKQAVMAALSALEVAAWPNTLIVPALCDLLERGPTDDIAAATARVLAIRGPVGDAADLRVHQALLGLLTSVSGETRRQADKALARFGDNVGRQFGLLLESCIPKEKLFDRVQSILKNGGDATVLATQAVQQLTQWMTRMSKETVERLSQTGGAREEITGDVYDNRIGGLMRGLVRNALTGLERSNQPERTEEMLALSIGGIRSTMRLAGPSIHENRDELILALHTVKQSLVYTSPSSPAQRKSEMREVADELREAAAESLIACYGAGCFGIFVEAAFGLSMDVQRTGMAALGRLGDVRALPLLQPYSKDVGSPLAGTAQAAIAAIKRTNPEMMTLLRASSGGDAGGETLLRAAAGRPDDTAPDVLLRPSAPQPVIPADSA